MYARTAEQSIENFLGLTSVGWTAVSALAAAATMIVAVIAAVLALRQLKQGRDLAEEQARPYVIAYLTEDIQMNLAVDLVVQNVGLTAARNVTVTLDREIVRSRGDDPAGHAFMDARFLKQPTAVLPPGGELRNFLDVTEQRSTRPDLASAFQVHVEYDDRRGQHQEDDFPLDFFQHEGTMRPVRHGVHHIASTLRAWAKKDGVHTF